MRRLVALTIVTLSVLSTSIVASSEQQTQFYMNLGEYYNIESDAVLCAVEQGLEDDDLAVVFKIAAETNVDYREVVDKRLSGTNWANIAADYGLNARNFYIEISGKIESQHYVPIFAKYRVTPAAQWEMIKLTDSDVRSLVNLEFIFNHHDYSPYQVMAMKDYGKEFVRINYQVEIARADMIKRDLAQKKQEDQVEKN
ncbi:MAG: hypothetical protein P1R58_12640 [bacterium]|nr:hypothetical protein [bacterium]